MNARAVQLLLAFTAVYIVWGSTYLAIRVVVQGLPPALSAGARFIAAGGIMLLYAWSRGARLPTAWKDWRGILVASVTMLVLGNGMVTWSEKWVDSNQAALVVATSALWIAWMGTLGARGERVGGLTIAGLLLGFAGVAVLVGGGLSAQMVPWYAYGALLLSPFFWALGSIYSKRNPVQTSPWMSVALQMCCAGVVLSLVGVAAGELPQWSWQPRSLMALAYLVVFGSCIAYGAYFWLVHEVSPSRLGTYAYVNPAIAVALGWWLLDERLNAMQIGGTAIILCGVVLVTVGSGRRSH